MTKASPKKGSGRSGWKARGFSPPKKSAKKTTAAPSQSLQAIQRRIPSSRNPKPSQRSQKVRAKDSSSPPIPVTPAASRLPLADNEISWRKFEEFCRAFVSKLPGVKSCNHYGKQGNAQRGIDLVATMQDGSEVTYQCRQWMSFKGTHAKKTIKQTTYAAKKHVILTSAEADVSARDAVRAHRKKWRLWDVFDIGQKIRELDPEDGRSVVARSFGDAWCTAFLGVGGLAAFRSPEFSLAPFLDSKRIFNHTHRLVARVAALRQLSEFSRSPSKRVAIVAGAGGVGKSRLLLEFARSVAAGEAPIKVLCVEEGVLITDAAIAQLPVGECIVIVDDAHRRDDLRVLLALTRQRPNLKLVLGARPHAVDRLQNELRQAKFQREELSPLLSLMKLSEDEILALVRAVLGSIGRSVRADLRIAALADGSPLVATIAAALVRERSIAPERVQNETEFAEEVFSKFEDALVGRIASHDDEQKLTRDLLPIVAAFSPIRLDDEPLTNAIASYLEVSTSRLNQQLGALERMGVLARAGRTLRITPDVLGDYILTRRSLTPMNEPSGFSSELLGAFGAERIGPLLRNFSELDWRVRHKDKDVRSGVGELWKSYELNFAQADAKVRDSMLGVLEDVAYYQPKRALGLVRAIISPGTPYGPLTGELVIRCVPVLVRAGYTVEHLRECIQLLLSLGLEAPTERESAIKALVDLSGYDLGKPFLVQEILMDEIENCLFATPAFLADALRIIKPMLAKTGLNTMGDRRQITMTSFPIPVTQTAGLRQRARSICQKAIASPTVSVRKAAFDIILEDLAPVVMTYGRHVSAAEQSGWEAERFKAIEIVEGALRDANDPILQLYLRSGLRWVAHHGPVGRLRDRAIAARDAVPDDFDHRLIEVLRGDLLDGGGEDFNYERDTALFVERARSAAKEFVATNPDPATAHKDLESRLVVLAAWGKQHSFVFFEALTEERPGYAIELMHKAIDERSPHLLSYLASVLSTARKLGTADTGPLVDKALGGDVSARFPVAVALRSTASNLTARDEEIWRTLLRDDDVRVRLEALRALHALSTTRSNLGVELGLSARFDGEEQNRSKLLDELCSFLHGVDDSSLTDADLANVLAVIERANSISDYWVRDFFARGMRRLPVASIRVLIARIERAPSSDFYFDAVPFEGLREQMAALRGQPAYSDVLDAVIAAGRRLDYLYSGANRLFRDLAMMDVATANEAIRNIASTGKAEDVKYAAELLAALPSATVLDQSPLVKDILAAAARLPSAQFERIESILERALVPSGWSSAVGVADANQLRALAKAQKVVNESPEGSLEHALFQKVAASIGRTIDQFLKEDEDWVEGA